MKLIVGLGNPGSEYEKTRHNVGFMAVDLLRDRCAPGAIPKSRFQSAVVEARLPDPDGSDQPALLMKPLTYMNLSGRSVAEAVRFYKLTPAEDVLVIVDEVQLPVGRIRVRADGSAGGHNGLANIEQFLGTNAYARIRIGIDRPGEHITQRDYVLGRFTEDQRPAVDEAVDKAAKAAITWAGRGITAAMNEFNTRPPKPKPARKEQGATDAEKNPENTSNETGPGASGEAQGNQGKAEQQ